MLRAQKLEAVQILQLFPVFCINVKQGVHHTVALAIYIKKYLKAKELL
jgi:hypothetical protein